MSSTDLACLQKTSSSAVIGIVCILTEGIGCLPCQSNMCQGKKELSEKVMRAQCCLSVTKGSDRYSCCRPELCL